MYMQKRISVAFTRGIGIFLVALVLGASSIHAHILSAYAQSAQSFFIDSAHDNAGRLEVQASLQLSSAQAYWFIEQDFLQQLSASDTQLINANVASLAQEFDT